VTYLAGVRLHGGATKPVWLRDCQDFWDAVEQARLRMVPESELTPLPAAPVRDGSTYDHLWGAQQAEHRRACFSAEQTNDDLIKNIEWVKPWPFNESKNA